MYKALLLSISAIMIGACSPALASDLQYDGTTMLLNTGKRISDDELALASSSQFISINELSKDFEEQDVSFVKKLDLSNNYLTDKSTETISAFVKNYLPSLEILDLSYNRFSEKAMKHFMPILLKENFQYLVMTGNDGASSMEGLKELVSSLATKFPQSSSSPQLINNYLTKVIWIPEAWLNDTSVKMLSPDLIKSHRQFFNLISH